MLKVLIADDNRFLRKSLVKIVGNIQHVRKIDEATDGQEALSKIKANDYNLVILDLSMPKINGMKILQEMKRLEIDSKVLVFSLNANDHVSRQVMALGAHSVVSKSASYNEIKNAIANIVQQILSNHN